MEKRFTGEEIKERFNLRLRNLDWPRDDPHVQSQRRGSLAKI